VTAAEVEVKAAGGTAAEVTAAEVKLLEGQQLK
jgi:hypothetical protein